jgi:acetylglutamate/LysW-gamma-L-alpha-aminoadipate kinase
MLIIKVGGGKNTNWSGIAADLKAFLDADQSGEQVVKRDQVILVHGASKFRDELAEKLDHATKRVTSPSGVMSVFTDSKALDIFLMAYAGLVNKRAVEHLQRVGINGVGLSGADGRLWEGTLKDKIYIKENGKVKLRTGNLTGKVEKINTELIDLLLEGGYLPVISSPGISTNGQIFNTDNDTAISLMAGSLGVERLVSLFEAPGLLKDPDDEASLINHIKKDRIDNYLKYAKGTMKKKVMAAKRAIKNGVREIYWGDSRGEHPLRDVLEGKGTVID